MSSAMLSTVLAILVVTVSAQLPTASIVSPVNVAAASRPATISPACAQDYTAVWTKNPSALMFALSGSYDYNNGFVQVANSTDGFATNGFYVPPVVFPPQYTQYPHKGGVLVQFAPPATQMWWTFGGETAPGTGAGEALFSYDNIQTWRSTLLGTDGQPFVWFAASATMPYTNYTLLAGGTQYVALPIVGDGIDYALNTVYYTTTANQYLPPPPGSNATNNPNDDAPIFTQIMTATPFPPFIYGNMVALFDNMYVPNTNTNYTTPNSTFLLVIGNSIYPTTTGGYTWAATITAPWSVNTDALSPGRYGASMTVDADNYIYFLGGNSGTSDLWFSNTKGQTWHLINITSGAQYYGASFSSCLGVRYTSPTQKTLVLYSGQIYQQSDLIPSAFQANISGLAIPVPSLYALTFNLSFNATNSTTQNSTIPQAIYPVNGPTAYNFTFSISGSQLNYLLTGEYWTICVTGTIYTNSHVQWMGTTPYFAYQFVTNATGIRVFSNQTFSISQSINGVSYNETSGNLLFPATPGHVDFSGITFDSPANLYFPGGYPGSTQPYGSFQADPNGPSSEWFSFTNVYEPIQDYYMLIFVEGQTNLYIDPVSSSNNFTLAINRSVATCPTSYTVAPAPPVVPSNPPLPIINTTYGSHPVNNYQSAENSVAGFVSIAGINLNYPNTIVLVSWYGQYSLGQYLSPNADGSLQFVFNENTSPPNDTWISATVVTIYGRSNDFPGWLVSGQYIENVTVVPPAIFSVSGSSCSSQTRINNVLVYGAVSCVPLSVITIAGTFFSNTTTVTVGGTSCSALTFVSTTQLTCTLPSVTATQYTTVQVIAYDNGFVSNYFSAMSLNTNTTAATTSSTGVSSTASANDASRITQLSIVIFIIWFCLLFIIAVFLLA